MKKTILLIAAILAALLLFSCGDGNTVPSSSSLPDTGGMAWTGYEEYAGSWINDTTWKTYLNVVAGMYSINKDGADPEGGTVKYSGGKVTFSSHGEAKLNEDGSLSIEGVAGKFYREGAIEPPAGPYAKLIGFWANGNYTAVVKIGEEGEVEFSYIDKDGVSRRGESSVVINSSLPETDKNHFTIDGKSVYITDGKLKVSFIDEALNKYEE